MGFGVQPLKVLGGTCDRLQKRQLRLTTYFIDRFWSLFHVPGISGLILPVVSPVIPVLTV